MQTAVHQMLSQVGARVFTCAFCGHESRALKVKVKSNGGRRVCNQCRRVENPQPRGRKGGSNKTSLDPTKLLFIEAALRSGATTPVIADWMGITPGRVTGIVNRNLDFREIVRTREVVIPIRPRGTVPSIYLCEHCGMPCTGLRGLEEHLRNCEQNHWWQPIVPVECICRHCSQSFSDSSSQRNARPRTVCDICVANPIGSAYYSSPAYKAILRERPVPETEKSAKILAAVLPTDSSYAGIAKRVGVTSGYVRDTLLRAGVRLQQPDSILPRIDDLICECCKNTFTQPHRRASKQRKWCDACVAAKQNPASKEEQACRDRNKYKVRYIKDPAKEVDRQRRYKACKRWGLDPANWREDWEKIQAYQAKGCYSKADILGLIKKEEPCRNLT